MYPEKYPEKFAGKYLWRCPQSYVCVRRHVCLHLNSDLYLDLSNKPCMELNHEKFEKSFKQLFQKSFASPFGTLFDLKYR